MAYNSEKEIIVDNSPDNEYQLIISEVGSASWPFGPSTGSIRLKKGSQTLSNTKVVIDTDGGCLYSDFSKQNGVTIMLE